MIIYSYKTPTFRERIDSVPDRKKIETFPDRDMIDTVPGTHRVYIVPYEQKIDNVEGRHVVKIDIIHCLRKTEYINCSR